MNPAALTLEEPLDIDDARQAARAMGTARREARKDYEKRIKEAADKKREYRKAKALAYVTADGPDAHARKADVEKRAADAEFAMELAEGMVKVAAEKLEEIDGERASLHRLMEWSMRLGIDGRESPPPYTKPIGGRS